MSCQMLSVEYIAEAANRIKVLLNQNSLNRFGFFVGKQVHEAFADCRDKYGFYQGGSIFIKLYHLNQKAYAGRYREEYNPEPFSSEQVQSIKVKPVPVLKYVNYHAEIRQFDFQTLKIWECLLYQLREDATIDDPVTEALSTIVDSMYRCIVQNSEHYQQCCWGCLGEEEENR